MCGALGVLARARWRSRLEANVKCGWNVKLEMMLDVALVQLCGKKVNE
jgi:hypothetical protein